jgi:hypothetical protein
MPWPAVAAPPGQPASDPAQQLVQPRLPSARINPYAGSDLALPQVQGPRPVPVRVINTYINRVLIAAERDPAVAEQFRVASLQDPATRLFRPSTARRVVLGNLRRRPEPAIDTTTRVPISGPRI